MGAEDNVDPAAKTIYGLSYLMEDKPWSDFMRGFGAYCAHATEIR